MLVAVTHPVLVAVRSYLVLSSNCSLLRLMPSQLCLSKTLQR